MGTAFSPRNLPDRATPRKRLVHDSADIRPDRQAFVAFEPGERRVDPAETERHGPGGRNRCSAESRPPLPALISRSNRRTSWRSATGSAERWTASRSAPRATARPCGTSRSPACQGRRRAVGSDRPGRVLPGLLVRFGFACPVPDQHQMVGCSMDPIQLFLAQRWYHREWRAIRYPRIVRILDHRSGK